MFNRCPPLAILSVILIAFLIPLSKPCYAEPEAADMREPIAPGKDVYNLKGCGGCHKIAGVGGDLGPDLTNEGNIISHDAGWHQRHFLEPQSVVPGSTMPKIDLTESERGALIAFLQSLKSEELPRDVEGAIKMAHEKLDESRKGIDEIKKSGFNVDNLEVKYVQGWTHLETINNRIYTHNLTGVYKETEEAVNIAKEIMQDVLSYKRELEHRVLQTIVFIVLMVIIAVLVFIKLLIV